MNPTIISLEQLEQSKIYVPQNQVFNFKHPIEYASRFVDMAKSLSCDVAIRVETNAQNANNDGTLNVSYETVQFRAKLPNRDMNFSNTPFDHLTSEFGFIVQLAGTAPQLRAYRGRRVSICDNGVIFGADSIATLKLQQAGQQSFYDSLTSFQDKIESDEQVYQENIAKMMDTTYDETDGSIDKFIGKLTRYSYNQKFLGVQMATGVLKLIENPSTHYGIRAGSITAWTLYNACTEELKKVSIKDEMAKVALLHDLFLV